MGNARVAHFVVTGEFITQQSRSFWAEEDEPERAINLLKNLHGITDAQILDILEGRSKLIGDSNGEGVQLVPDKVKLPTLKEVIGKLKRERDEARDDTADAVQLLNGDTEGVGSPTGLRLVPRRKTKTGKRGRPVLADGYEFPDCNKADSKDRDLRFFREGSSDPIAARRAERVIMERIEEAEDNAPPPRPLEHDDTITSDAGWLSPDGKFYGCSYGQHNQVAHMLHGDPWEMDEAGWIRCQVVDEEQTFFHRDYKTVTDAQKAKILARCTEKGTKQPWWMERE